MAKPLHRKRETTERHRMKEWHPKGTHTQPENRPKHPIDLAARKVLRTAKKTITKKNIVKAWDTIDRWAAKSDKTIAQMRKERGGRLF